MVENIILDFIILIQSDKNLQIEFIADNPYASFPKDNDGDMKFNFYTFEGMDKKGEISSEQKNDASTSMYYTGASPIAMQPNIQETKINWKRYAPDLESFDKWYPNFIGKIDYTSKGYTNSLYDSGTVIKTFHYQYFEQFGNTEVPRDEALASTDVKQYKIISNPEKLRTQSSSAGHVILPSFVNGSLGLEDLASQKYADWYDSAINKLDDDDFNDFDHPNSYKNYQNEDVIKGWSHVSDAYTSQWDQSMAQFGVRMKVEGDFLYMKAYTRTFARNNHYVSTKGSYAYIKINDFNLSTGTDWYQPYLSPLNDPGDHSTSQVEINSPVTIKINENLSLNSFSYFGAQKEDEAQWVIPLGGATGVLHMDLNRETVNKLFSETSSSLGYESGEYKSWFNLNKLIPGYSGLDSLKNNYSKVVFTFNSSQELKGLKYDNGKSSNDLDSISSPSWLSSETKINTQDPPSVLSDSKISESSTVELAVADLRILNAAEFDSEISGSPDGWKNCISKKENIMFESKDLSQYVKSVKGIWLVANKSGTLTVAVKTAIYNTIKDDVSTSRNKLYTDDIGDNQAWDEPNKFNLPDYLIYHGIKLSDATKIESVSFIPYDH